jgi:hypothetical protein
MAKLSDRVHPWISDPWDRPTWVEAAWLKVSDTKKPQDRHFKQQLGDTNMSKLKTVNLTLIDNHPDLKAAEKIVFQQLNYVTEHTNDQTIQQVLMTGDVESALAKHNAKRAKVVDDAILRQTGRDVFLKPVEIWDLEWSIVQVG